MFHLRTHRILLLEGPDALSFLQGQTTNDAERLENGFVQQSAHCNHKGRMISSFKLGRINAESYVLRLHESLASIAMEALKKYMVFSKATLSATELAAFVLEKPNDERVEQIEQLREIDGALVFADQTSDFVELYIPETSLSQLSAAFHGEALSDADWESKMVALGISEVRGPTTEKFLPQEFNYDVTGGVNFKKGCYTGQEIIARLHYKGQAKKRLRRGRIASEQRPISGDEIRVISTQKNKGEVLFAHNIGEKHYEFLAVVSNDALESECALSSDLATKIEWLPLPYAIP